MTNKTPVDIFCDHINYQYGTRITNYTITNEFFENLKKLEEDYHRVTEDTSDGYHTFKELYDFRAAYNALLFNEWASQKGYEEFLDVNLVAQNTKHSIHKSWKHNDGDSCFGGGWFIVVAKLPSGQISNHYPAEIWNDFKVPETTTALFPFDGHTSQNVLERLKKELV
jgi:hypothetical protein